MVAVQRSTSAGSSQRYHHSSWSSSNRKQHQCFRLAVALFLLSLFLLLVTTTMMTMTNSLTPHTATTTQSSIASLAATSGPQQDKMQQFQKWFSKLANSIEKKKKKKALRESIPVPKQVLMDPPKDEEIPVSSPPCPYQSMSDLTEEELHPVAGMRHMVTPPQGGAVSLVCCHTTKGPLNLAIHDKWAHYGAQRFLDMVKSGYFNNEGVPFMRCFTDFICQFGLAGSKSKLFGSYIEPDFNWLPSGPENRENQLGVRRFARGYLAYAANDAKTRSNQFLIALQSSGPLGGGLHEMPIGEVVGSHSFDTLSTLYTGYGEGPPQEILWKKEGMSRIKKDFPLLDYFKSCRVVDELLEE